MSNQYSIATWCIPLNGKTHQVEFEHGTASGKRIIRVDGMEVLRKDWMFKLVGREVFLVDTVKCAVIVETLGAFNYRYNLEVNGKSIEKLYEEQGKQMQRWAATVDGIETTIGINKGTMDVYVNGQKIDTAGEFVENGTETHFAIKRNICCIKSQSSGKKSLGIVHRLYINGREIHALNCMN